MQVLKNLLDALDAVDNVEFTHYLATGVRDPNASENLKAYWKAYDEARAYYLKATGPNDDLGNS
jgi:hypothetical protein